MGCWVLASSYSTLLHLPAPSTHHPAGDLGVLPEGGQLAPALPEGLVLNPGTPLLPGNLGLGGGVTRLEVLPALPKLFLGRGWGQDPSVPQQPNLGVTPCPPPWGARWAAGCTLPAPHIPGSFPFLQGQQGKLGGPSSAPLPHKGPTLECRGPRSSAAGGQVEQERATLELLWPELLGKPSSPSLAGRESKPGREEGGSAEP